MTGRDDCNGVGNKCNALLYKNPASPQRHPCKTSPKYISCSGRARQRWMVNVVFQSSAARTPYCDRRACAQLLSWMVNVFQPASLVNLACHFSAPFLGTSQQQSSTAQASQHHPCTANKNSLSKKKLGPRSCRTASNYAHSESQILVIGALEKGSYG